jgi:3-methyl-2-oxobutanoate hydroxymethyltransferase
LGLGESKVSVHNAPKAVTIKTLAKLKAEGEKFSCMTAYDYCQAYAVSNNGVELILVGDSLGMVVHGHDSSLPVTVEDIAYHIRCVRRGNVGSLIMADMPFMSYYSEDVSLRNAASLMSEGAHMVKLEGGAWLAESTRLLSERGIPVCAHMGLTPQSVNHLGGYSVQGRDPDAAQTMIDEALMLQEAGASVLLLECIPEELGERITKALDIPIIGIGAGAKTDGQILVWHDMMGLWPGRPAKFVKNFLKETDGSIDEAIKLYTSQVKAGSFPGPEHSYE